MKIDESLVRQLQVQIAQGSQPAFEQLYRLFFPRLHSFALIYVYSRETAEEVVNDVMVRIWETRTTVTRIEKLETYLFVAVRNHSLNHWKKFSRLHVQSVEEGDLSSLVTIDDPEKALEWKEIHHALSVVIEKLPDQCRTVFKLIKEEGFRYKEVAEILGVSPRTVETQLFRAIRKLDAVVRSFSEKPAKRRSGGARLISWFWVILFISMSL